MAIYDDYISAIKSGNTSQANYLAQMLAANAGININTNTVTAAPLAMAQNGLPALPALPQLPSFWDSFYKSLDSIGNSVGNWGNTTIGAEDAPMYADRNGAGHATAEGATATVKDVWNSFSLARLATIIIGAILITAGLFGLTGAHNIVLNLAKPK